MISTDGILCYGFRLKKDEEGEKVEGAKITVIDWLCKDGVQMDFEDFLAILVGLKQPHSYYSVQIYDTDSKYRREWENYWKKKDQLENQIGVTLVRHCSNKYPMYILAATASVQRARRGCPIELGNSLVAQDEWREKIRAFCVRADIPFEEPRLILCSFWG